MPTTAWDISRDDFSSHVCHGEDRASRTCVFHNVYIWKGMLYYISPDERARVPQVDMVWHVGKMFDHARNLPINVLTPKEVPRDIMLHKPDDIPLSVLWYRLDLINNFSHMVAETSFSVHKLMCEFLNLCEYGQPKAEDFQLVFIDPKPEFPIASISEAFKCFSDREPVLFSQIREDDRVRRLKTTVAGIGPECRAFHYCMGSARLEGGRERMSAEILKSWRTRMLTCVGADPARRAGLSQSQDQANSFNKQLVAFRHEVRLVDNPVQKPIVLLVNRSYPYARSFLNLKEILAILAHGLPQYEVKYVFMENQSYATQVHLFNSASVVVMAHGGVFGNVPFMPHEATVIEVMPNGPFCNDFHEFYADGLVRDISTVTNITLVEFDVHGRDNNHLRMDILSRDPWYTNLTAHERLELLEQSKCPEEGPRWSDEMFRRQRCKVNWLLKAVDMELDVEILAHRILEVPVPGMQLQFA